MVYLIVKKAFLNTTKNLPLHGTQIVRQIAGACLGTAGIMA
jgi:hypothetical protein